MKLIQFLKGKKTYLLGLAGLAYAIGGFSTGHLAQKEALDAAWASLTVIMMRAGIKNSTRGTDVPPQV